jgi:hypothetical protein
MDSPMSSGYVPSGVTQEGPHLTDQDYAEAVSWQDQYKANKAQAEQFGKQQYNQVASFNQYKDAVYSGLNAMKRNMYRPETINSGNYLNAKAQYDTNADTYTKDLHDTYAAISSKTDYKHLPKGMSLYDMDADGQYTGLKPNEVARIRQKEIAQSKMDELEDKRTMDDLRRNRYTADGKDRWKMYPNYGKILMQEAKPTAQVAKTIQTPSNDDILARLNAARSAMKGYL